MNGFNPSWRYSTIILGLAVLVLLIMDFNARTAEWRSLAADKEIVSERYLNLLQTQSALQAEIAYATSEPAVMEWAYGDAHLIRPGDSPIIPIPQGPVTPTVTPAPIITQESVQNWQRWVQLFTDTHLP